jgi:hypothetical protein
MDLPSRCTTNSHTASSEVPVGVSYCLVGMNKISMHVHMRGCTPWIYQAGAQQILTQQVAKFLLLFRTVWFAGVE